MFRLRDLQKQHGSLGCLRCAAVGATTSTRQSDSDADRAILAGSLLVDGVVVLGIPHVTEIA